MDAAAGGGLDAALVVVTAALVGVLSLLAFSRPDLLFGWISNDKQSRSDDDKACRERARRAALERQTADSALQKRNNAKKKTIKVKLPEPERFAPKPPAQTETLPAELLLREGTTRVQQQQQQERELLRQQDAEYQAMLLADQERERLVV